ncbi:Peroxiredoxin-4 [Orchesella cincta]|uniref:thioredoxin-dependent peroxiredoxin n=1 Tax=Orchesella cincta TaxID=48709 RepID=A0A1D2MII4_ORCCI|nr:Peroxiredoxin-4 [Orchesella cincta]
MGTKGDRISSLKMCFFIVTVFQLLCVGVLADQCYSFAGGSVYPQETAKSSGHTLQWTKAMISKPAPPFEGTAVINGSFQPMKLSDFKGKYVVFFFYPLDFTFVCPTEILAFNDRIDEFKKINAEVIACSVDSHYTHLAWINTPRKEGGLGPLMIPLLSDLTHTISKDYGVYLRTLVILLGNVKVLTWKLFLNVKSEILIHYGFMDFKRAFYNRRTRHLEADDNE